MQRSLPLGLCFIMGILMIIQFFSPHPISQQFFDTIIKWIRIISAFALVLGVRSISLRHIEAVKRRKSGFVYSIFTLLALVITAVLGLVFGIGPKAPIRTIFNNILVPLGATMFSILAFYMASAAYRAFRARTFEATLLLISAFIVMLGMVPIGNWISPHFPAIAEWILSVPNMAAKRGILFGVALGVIATSLKIILGIERGWLGGRR
ncbi:MAG: hypothetical protein N2323_02585 [candidate division WOR-3 bacterium]|nr:hypothetical protein [candidate division WOR-3 bacterium]MCX7836834.1 hypothetical protein [candidate division WOR-3 bacterium]MDW8114296.1 hypothetical protein [candidate division WOR-3 bacterium]